MKYSGSNTFHIALSDSWYDNVIKCIHHKHMIVESFFNMYKNNVPIQLLHYLIIRLAYE